MNARCLRGLRAWRATAVLLLTVVLAPALPAGDEGPRLPVVSLRYENGCGYREMVPDPDAPAGEDAQMEDYSRRHKLTLRLKEQWSDGLVSNLYTVAARKDSDDASESYAYFYVNPDLAWTVGPRLKWSFAARCKLTWLEPGAFLDSPVDLLGLVAKTSLTWRLAERVKLVPSLQSAFDLYQDWADPGRTAQTYSAGLALESELAEGVELVGRYRGSFRFPLGPLGTIDRLSNNEFSLSLTWDPND